VRRNFNGDDYKGLTIGDAVRNGLFTDQGLVQIYYGNTVSSSPFSMVLALQDPSPMAVGHFGWWLAMGDTGGSARDDLLVGVPGYKLGTSDNAGKVILFRF